MIICDAQIREFPFFGYSDGTDYLQAHGWDPSVVVRLGQEDYDMVVYAMVMGVQREELGHKRNAKEWYDIACHIVRRKANEPS